MRPTPLLLLLSGAALASPRADLKAGVQAAATGEHARAQELLTSALEAQEQALSDKLSTRARYELGRSWLDAMVLASATGDVSALGDEPAWQAFINLRTASQGKGRWARRASEELAMARPILLQESLNFLELGESERADRDLSALIDLEPDPKVLSLRAAGRLASDRVEAGVEDAALALERYQADPPEAPDPSIATTASQAALMAHWELGQTDRALAMVDQATSLVQADEARARDARDQALLQEARQTLVRTELTLLQDSEDHRERALACFQAAAEDNPHDAVIWTAYGSLVAEVDPEAAILILDNAVSMDPKARDAHLVLGGLYLNQALQVQQRTMESLEPQPELEAEVERLMREARPHLEAAWEADPADGAVVGSLLTIALHLGDDEAARHWTEVKKDMRD